MKLANYLARIGFAGEPRPDFATLTAIHRLHANAIAFENLDVQLGRKLTTDVEAAFDKIVRRRRGGWCYEQNGLLGWALGAIGFDVTRVAAGVMRESAGDSQMGGHLCLIVQLGGQRWLCDVGFGGSMTGPLALEAGERRDEPYAIGLRESGDGYWRFWESDGGAPFSFDFRDIPADESLIAAKCVYQQTNEASPFVQNLVVQLRAGDTHASLRGRVLSETGSEREHKLESADEFVALLRSRFTLDVPETADLWPAICARHEALGLP
jgi:N-hydroxyarylamine O-acetyltransferase